MRKNDFILIAVIIIMCIASIILFRVISTEGDYAVINKNGAEYARYPLSSDRVIRIDEDGLDYNVINIEDGKVYISDADCPDRICADHSAISRTGESIICLPHKLSVTIESSKSGGDDIDGISQ